MPERDRPGLAPEVRDFEPDAALFGSDDGLGIMTSILDSCRDALAMGGRLITEIGFGQDDRVKRALQAFPEYVLESTIDDLQRIPRVWSCDGTPRPSTHTLNRDRATGHRPPATESYTPRMSCLFCKIVGGRNPSQTCLRRRDRRRLRGHQPPSARPRPGDSEASRCDAQRFAGKR